MNTLTLDVREPQVAVADYACAWRNGETQATARISCATPELLRQVLSAKHWVLLNAQCGAPQPLAQLRTALQLGGIDQATFDAAAAGLAAQARVQVQVQVLATVQPLSAWHVAKGRTSPCRPCPRWLPGRAGC